MRLIKILALIICLGFLCIIDTESSITTKKPAVTTKKSTTKPKTTTRVTTRKTTTKPETFCSKGWTRYYLKNVLHSNSTMFQYEDAAVCKNGSFYLVRFSSDENMQKNGFAIDFFDENGMMMFSKINSIEFNGTQSGYIKIVLDAKGNLYVYLTLTSYENRDSHLMKLSPNGDLLKSLNNNQMVEGFMSYSKYDDLLYFKFPDRLIAFETNELSVVMHRLIFFPIYSTQFIPVSKDKFYAFDGISLLKYDLKENELVIKPLKNTFNYELSFSSVVLGECILVGLSTEYSSYSQMGNVTLNAVLLNDERIEMPFNDMMINNPALLLKATEDNRIYMFDGVTNSVYILDYLRF